jgi:hypothetical protein
VSNQGQNAERSKNSTPHKAATAQPPSLLQPLLPAAINHTTTNMG